jgi:hypothetical protein
VNVNVQPDRKRRIVITVLAIVGGVAILALVVGMPLIQSLTRSFVPVSSRFPTATPFTGAVTEADIIAIGDRLRAAGLTESGYLSSTGVAEHLRRLHVGEVSLEGLHAYANDLQRLAEVTATYGEAIPTPFWDVQTAEMRANTLTEYGAVAAIAMPGSEPYLALLAQAYNRLARLHADEQDTAVNAAFDVFQSVVDYYEEVSGLPPDNAEGRAGYGRGLVLVWQQVMFSTSRNNPLTGERLITHDVFNHFNVTDMWRYRVGESLGIGEIWGVSGFAPRFVGDPKNDNQVEHTTISMTLQLVLGEPLIALNLIEDRDLLTGHESTTHAAADIAINTVVGDEFEPRFAVDFRAGIEYLRCALTDREPCSSTSLT